MNPAVRTGRDVWTGFNEDKVTRLASAVAFSALLSLAPLLIVLIGIVGWFLGLQNGGHGHHLAEDALLTPIRQAAGPAAEDAVRQLVSATFNKPRQSVIAQSIGWITFVFGAMALFSAVQDALNAIWRIEGMKGGWRQVVRDRLTSFIMVALVAVLLLISLLGNSAMAVVANHFPAWGAHFVGGHVWVSAFGPVVTLVVGCVAFAAIYRVLPDVRIAWRDVWLGAAATSVLFLIGETLIAFYLAKAGTTSAYGAAGALLVILLWIYYSSIVFLLGAEFTKAIARHPETTVDATLRENVQRPAGSDPRSSVS